jgi:lipopolysaccharide/colanic/teichoic acid biosynthesis glycosyltransferase
LDVAAAALLGALAILLTPFVALAIKLDSAGEIFFRQKRTGKGGSEFDLIKFRTMRQDAEAQGAQWAAEKDSRITRVGGFMRKTRIDELPQLWNVIKGEMSLVGPRPERPEFVQELAQSVPFYGARHLVKPGLTGWAQINFRYGASVDDAMEKLQHDLYYIKNRSVSLELSILLKTVGTVLRYEGR